MNDEAVTNNIDRTLGDYEVVTLEGEGRKIEIRHSTVSISNTNIYPWIRVQLDKDLAIKLAHLILTTLTQ